MNFALRHLFFVSLLLGFQPAYAQEPEPVLELEPEVLYEPGDVIKVSLLGMQLQIPEKWQAGLPDGSAYLLLEHVDGYVAAILMADKLSHSDIEHIMSNNMDLGDGVVLVMETAPLRLPSGDFRTVYSLEYGGDRFHAVAQSVRGPHGISAICIVYELSIVFCAEEELKNILKTLRFFEPLQQEASNQPAHSQKGSGGGEYHALVNGRLLKYLNTEGGGSTSDAIWLCRDGSFAREFSESYYSGGYADFSYAGDNKAYGRWKVEADILYLFEESGETYQFTMYWNGNELLLNNRRFFRLDNDRCP